MIQATAADARDLAQQFDFVVVGGGTSGCVLAARLSADPHIRVLLIEAGRDFAGGVTPESIASAGFRAHHEPGLWATPLRIERDPAPQNADQEAMFFRAPQVLGGGSSVNGMHAQRGLPEDYDSWAEHGVRGWSWNDVLPYFVRLETDSDFNGAEHGIAGPITIARIREARWSALSRSIRLALAARGVPFCEDLVTSRGDCVAPVPLNIRGARRASVPESYLTPEVRRRANLVIRCDSRALRLCFEGTRVVGIEVETADARHIFRARETIVSAGVIGSPLLLLRSGIGPARQLAESGIAVRANRRGVGHVLRNHAHLSIGVHLRPSGRQQRDRIAPCAMVARFSSGLPEAPTDMMLNVWERMPGALERDPLSRRFAVLMVLLNVAYSTGDLQLDAADPMRGARLRFNALDDPRDLERMVQGVRLVMDILQSDDVSPLITEAFVPRPNRIAALLNRDNRLATLVSVAGSVALAGPSVLRRTLLRTQGIPLQSVAGDERRLRELVRRETRGASHGTSTCTMGDVSDPLAVTDSRCNVIGVQGLRVVDCSIFPTLIRAGTHIPAIMAAEYAADLILGDRRQT